MQGRIEEFSAGSDWSSWSERLAFHFEAHDVTQPSKKRAILLSVCGEQTYATLRALLFPRRPGEVDYDDVVRVLSEHFDPKPSELLGRCRFHKRDQLPSETISQYVAALRTFAKDCNFGTSPAPAAPSQASSSTTEQGASSITPSTMLPLNVMLRDRFICGIKDANLQQRLLVERDITFERAFDIALAAESAASQQAQMKAPSQVPEVYSTSCATTNQELLAFTGACFRCTGKHEAATCKHCDAICH